MPKRPIWGQPALGPQHGTHSKFQLAGTVHILIVPAEKLFGVSHCGLCALPETHVTKDNLNLVLKNHFGPDQVSHLYGVGFECAEVPQRSPL